MEHSDVKRLRTLEDENGKLQGHRMGDRKRAFGTRKPMVLPDAPNQRRSFGFAFDALADGRRLRILAVVDDYS